MIQYCVLFARTGEVWRGDDGTWTRDDCMDWITEEPALPPLFVLGWREVGEWARHSGKEQA